MRRARRETRTEAQLVTTLYGLLDEARSLEESRETPIHCARGLRTVLAFVRARLNASASIADGRRRMELLSDLWLYLDAHVETVRVALGEVPAERRPRMAWRAVEARARLEDDANVE